MKIRLIVLFITLSLINKIESQTMNLPYYEIPKESKTYTPGTVVARMIDGLGFRFYWATHELRSEDLIFRPSEDGRTTGDIVDHILGLTDMIFNTAQNRENGVFEKKEMSFNEKRANILIRLKEAADIFRNSDDLKQFKIIFNTTGQRSEFPFWYQINGPIADAIWHCGQIVSHRRTSGNPFNSKANVFRGTVKQ